MTDPAEAERWRRAWELCEEAYEVPPAAREGWLAGRCARDAELLADVRLLLGDDGTEVAAARPHTRPFEPIGPYDIDALLGSGGMGLVYRGRNRELGLVAAVKVIHHDRAQHGETEGVERFRREMRLLARLSHPGIVRIHETGRAVDEAGREISWFAMELVDGPLAVTEYVQRTAPSRERLLALCLEICEALAHAHAHGVLHRDLKPSNLLVDSSGRVRVIDFGVGRLLEDGHTSATLTVEGSVVGTLNYLAPECLDGKQADERSDVYALGLVLEELALGRPRFEFSATPFGIQALREAQRQPPPPLESRAAPVELGWIVAKATDPSPQRRYSDAGEVAEDLRRLLGTRPISARPIGRLHRARLYALRNRGFVTAAGVVLAVLSAGLAATSLALVRESQALGREQRATKVAEEALAGEKLAKARAEEALESERVAKSAAEASAAEAVREGRANEMIANFLEQAFKRAPAGVPYTVEAALEDAVDQIQAVLESEPEPFVQARVLHFLGKAFADRRSWPRALTLLGEAVVAFESAGIRRDEEWTRAVIDLHRAMTRAELFEQASELTAVLVRGGRDTTEQATLRLFAMLNFASHFDTSGRTDLAYPLYEAVLEEADRSHPEQFDIVLSATANLGFRASAQGDLRLSKQLSLEVWQWRSEHQPELPRTYRSARSAADAMVVLGDIEEALALLDEAEALALANDLGLSFEFVDLREIRAKAYSALGNHEGALALALTCLNSRRTVQGDRQPDVLVLRDNIAVYLTRAGQLDRAIEWNEETYELRSDEYGPDHCDTLRTLGQLGRDTLAAGRAEDGLLMLDEARRGLIAIRGRQDVETLRMHTMWIDGLTADGRLEEALLAHTELVDFLETVPSLAPLQRFHQLDRLSILYHRTDRPAEAAEVSRRGLLLLEELGTEVPELIAARMRLGGAQLKLGDVAAAEAQLELAIEEAARIEAAGGSADFWINEFRGLFPRAASEPAQD